MTISQQIATHFRQLHFGGNWVTVNLKETLLGLSWEQATTQVQEFNTIATLTYHTHYYVYEVLKVLNGEPLVASDKYSFNHPPLNSQSEWDEFLDFVWKDAEAFADKVEQLPDSILLKDFTDSKYGSYYRNLHGIIEHTHYHLGQIVIIKKML